MSLTIGQALLGFRLGGADKGLEMSAPQVSACRPTASAVARSISPREIGHSVLPQLINSGRRPRAMSKGTHTIFLAKRIKKTSVGGAEAVGLCLAVWNIDNSKGWHRWLSEWGLSLRSLFCPKRTGKRGWDDNSPKEGNIPGARRGFDTRWLVKDTGLESGTTSVTQCGKKWWVKIFNDENCCSVVSTLLAPFQLSTFLL